ncbi:MAG: hypothetical protein U5J62_03870 [Desulfurivibrio sp.]|nr:hypothetical protein [Desulfurivibrio sp.]
MAYDGINSKGLLLHRHINDPKKPDLETAQHSCRLFVVTVDEIFACFLKNRNNWAQVRVERYEEDFFDFMVAAGLSGDRENICQSLREVKNVNKNKHLKNSWISRIRAMFSPRRLF